MEVTGQVHALATAPPGERPLKWKIWWNHVMVVSMARDREPSGYNWDDDAQYKVGQ